MSAAENSVIDYDDDRCPHGHVICPICADDDYEEFEDDEDDD